MPTTHNRNVYIRYVPGDPIDASHNRIIGDQFGHGNPGPLLGPANIGDTFNFSVFFVDQGSDYFGVPYRIRRFQGYGVEANVFAIGNLTSYGTSGISTAEIVPATSAPVVTRLQSAPHHDGVEEIHRVQFASFPATGQIRFKFGTAGGLPGNGDGGVGRYGNFNLPVWATIADFQQSLRNLQAVNYNSGTPVPVGPLDAWDPYVIVSEYTPGWGIFDMKIEYQRGSPYTGVLPKVVLDVSDTQYFYGYTVTLVLNNPSFLDLFLPANAPAFLNFLLYAGGIPPGTLTAQQTLVTGTPGEATVADFVADQFSGPVGTTINFTDLSTNFPTSWLWDFGDGTTSTSQNPSHTYTRAGSYTVSLTVDNANAAPPSTAVKPSYISIEAPIDPGGGGDDESGNLPATYFDGNYADAVEVDQPRRELRDDHPGLEIWHQTYETRAANFVPVAIGAAGGKGGRIALDTIWSPQGSDVVRWERISHNIPPDRQFPIQATKNMQTANYSFSGGLLIDFQIYEWSQEIQGTCYVHYFMSPGTASDLAIPRVPTIMIVPVYGGGKQISDVYTGFPVDGSGFYTTNRNVETFITGGFEHVIGNLYCRKIIKGV